MSDPIRERWSAADAGRRYARDRWRSARAAGRDPRLAAKLVARVLGDVDPGEAPGPLLDVPSGAGRLRQALERTGRRVVSVDASASMLEAVGSGPRVRGVLPHLPFGDGAFDVVVCCRLLHHLAASDELERAVRELVRVASLGVVASYWDAASWHAWRRRTTGPLRRRRRGDARVAVPAARIDGAFASAGATVEARAHSFRLVSPQTFVLARRG